MSEQNGQASTGDPATNQNQPSQGSDPAAAGGASASTAVAPEKYEAFKLPDGFAFEEPTLKRVTEFARTANLPQESAQNLVNLGVEFAQGLQAQLEKQIAESVEKTQKEWLEAGKADKDIGGAKYDQAVKDAQRALQYARPGLKALLDSFGLGNHPDVIHAFSLFGGMIKPDSMRPDSNTGAAPAGDDLESRASKFFTHPTSKGKAA